MASCVRVRCRAAARAPVRWLLLGVVAVLGGATWPACAGAAPAQPAPAVRLVHVTPVVHRAGQPVVVVVTRTGPAAAQGASLQLTLYARLTTRSALLAAISSTGPSSSVSTTGALDAGCLASGSALSVAVAVAPDGVAVPPRQLCGTAAPVLRLGCTDGCDGVYPLRVTVRGDGTSATIDTLVTYAPTTTSTPLHLAWILRVAGTAGALNAAAPALRRVVAHPEVPVTVDVQGQAVAAATPSPTVALLAAAVARRAHELINEAYVPAELGTLRASGLPEEVRRQFGLDAEVLRDAGVHKPPSPLVTYGTGPQTPTGADALGHLGFRGVVVPGTALAVDPATTLHWGEAFRLGGSPSGPAAMASDTELSALSDDTATDPALVAANFLGQLAFLHFEEPDLSEPRVAVVVTDVTSAVTASFVDTVLTGLSGNPVVVPVTISSAFRHDPVGANGFPAVRDLVLGPSPSYNTATINTFRFLRITTDALASAVRLPGDSPIPSIEGELLSAEQVLSATARAVIFKSLKERLADQLGYFHIYDGPITLTQAGASLPITIFSTAPYNYAGFLKLSSPKLSFPGGDVIQLQGPNGAVKFLRVAATAEVTGDIPLTATLLSPDRRLRMATAQITVRATHTSIVGIALTVLAVVVLALWWIRTSRRRRAGRA